MRYALVLVTFLLLSSCSVKKKVLSQKTDTTVTVKRRDTVVVNSQLDEIEVVVQDTTQPVTVKFVSENRPPVTKTFTNVRSVKISNKLSREVSITDQNIKTEEQKVEKQRDVEKNNYLWPILIVVALIWLSSMFRFRR
jgi:hypothetical protein